MRLRNFSLLLLLLASIASAAPRPNWIGLSFNYRLEENSRWLQLCAVAPDGPAARAGLQRGDLITHIAGKPIALPDARAVIEYFAKANRRVKLRVARGPRTFDTFLTPVPMNDTQYRTYQQNVAAATPRK
ncbi:MAG TPA: PDZ domain-containing protein [Thermoanaerobaculia bacterium]|nr:PDZ domain-containing protein [Thermoanaerobaculia bacterium]